MNSSRDSSEPRRLTVNRTGRPNEPKTWPVACLISVLSVWLTRHALLGIPAFLFLAYHGMRSVQWVRTEKVIGKMRKRTLRYEWAMACFFCAVAVRGFVRTVWWMYR